MIKKTLGFLFGVAAIIIASTVLANTFYPQRLEAIGAYLTAKTFGWDEQTCGFYPVQCLQGKYRMLSDTERRLSEAIEMLKTEEARAKNLVSEQNLLKQKNMSYLKSGREVYLANASNPDHSVEFAGRTYPNLNKLKLQLKLLFSEKVQLAESAKKAAQLEKRLRKKWEALMIRQAGVRAERQMIPGKVALVRGNSTLVNISENISMIDDLVDKSEDGLKGAETLIGTTKDLMKSESRIGDDDADHDDFEAFLTNPKVQ